MNEWTKKEALEYYRLKRWGDGYFGINDLGELSVFIDKNSDHSSISIPQVIQEMKNQKVSLPAVIRFHDILRQQVQEINQVFKKVIKEAGYKASYRGVFPIKVNQMREVVEEVVDAGKDYSLGLEAGSKTELLAVLSQKNNVDSLTILNGYKDEEYMKLAMLGKILGRKMIIVVEKFSEIPLLIKVAKEMKVIPSIGIRTKLSTVGRGKWKSSSGDKAKFGLSATEIMKAIELLEKEGLLDAFKLIHFHIGSQLCDIRDIKDAMNEGARIYVDLIKRGVPLEYFDAGGGLGVDYDGTQSSNDSSINYNMEIYAADIVYILKQICDLENVRHPIIVTESGRALTASHSIVVTSVIDKILVGDDKNLETGKREGEHILLSNMRDLVKDLEAGHLQDIFNDAKQFKQDALNAFKLGVLNLSEKAKIETLYWRILKKIKTITETLAKEDIPEDLKGLKEVLSSKYLCNFSVFQSLPDCWAIGQLLPIVPLERLNERPTVDCSLADITCDSDGKIDKFIGDKESNTTLLLHEINKDDEYNLGIFMTGAYQDVMGDNHNLFGRLNEVHIYSDKTDSHHFYIEEVIKGTSSQKVLETLQYNNQSMVLFVKKILDQEVKDGKVLPREGVKLVDFYEGCLEGYTYLGTDPK